ncbi:MAG: hypothetical protein AABN95_26065, partial [Acidobacteriota bacterium]
MNEIPKHLPLKITVSKERKKILKICKMSIGLVTLFLKSPIPEINGTDAVWSNASNYRTQRGS